MVAGVRKSCMAGSSRPGTNGRRGQDDWRWCKVSKITEVDSVRAGMEMFNFAAPRAKTSVKVVMSSTRETLFGGVADSESSP